MPKESNKTMYDLTATYDEEFYEGNADDSHPTARYLAPHIVEHFGVKRMIDYGCATGHWLSEFHGAGVAGLGIEGSTSIASKLLVDKKHILIHDLRFPVANKKKIKSFLEGGDVDLAFTFEVAEHVEGAYADILVDNILTGNPRWVIMTAAPPGQGGLGHVNEQPRSYWVKKFTAHGYETVQEGYDFLAKLIADGRARTDAPPEFQRSEMARICDWFEVTRGCEKGIWSPNWLPRNLIVLRKR